VEFELRKRARTVRFVALAGVVALLGALVVVPIVVRPQTASAVGVIAYPDLQSVIPADKFQITHSTPTSTEFQYEHIVFNAGQGPLDVLPTYDPVTASASGMQRLYSYDASNNPVLEQQLPVHDQFLWHQAHGHFHFPLASFGIYATNPDGSLGSPVALSPKVGFCIGDSVRVDPTITHSPATISYTGATCVNPSAVRGIDPGWGDLYDRLDPGQSIDMTGVPDGTYWFHSVVDPGANFAESDESNNVTDIKISITGDVVKTVSPLVSQGSFIFDQSIQATTTNSSGIATSAFSTSAPNELLVAFFSAQGSAGVPQTSTVSGAGLTWTLAKRSNAQAGTAEVWTALAPTALANVVVSAKLVSGLADQAMTVMAIKGAKGIGAVAATSGTTGAPVAALTTTAPGSWLMGVANDPDNYTPHTPISGQVMVQQWLNKSRSNATWVQATTAPTPASSTTVNLGDTYPVGDHWNFVGVELLAAVSNDHIPPVLSGDTVTAIGPDRATVNWTSDEPATSQIDYGPTLAYGASTALDPSLITSHSQTITGLAPSTSYSCLLRSADSSGNTATKTASFTTSAPRVVPPVFSNVRLSDLQADQATFAWTTDELADSQVEFGTTIGYGSSSTRDPAMTSTHFVLVTGLVPSTIYHYRVKGLDAYGNAGVSGDATFTTPALAPPVTVDATVSSDGRGSVTTPVLSAPAGDLLVAFVSADGPSVGFQSTIVSGAGLTWTLATRANSQPGVGEVWQALSPNALTNVTVTARSTIGTTYDLSATVVAFKGAIGVGASSVASGASGTAGLALKMSRTGSLVYAVGNDWDRAIARVPNTGQSLVHQWLDAGSGDTFWTQSLDGAAGPVETVVTMGDTAPSGDRWNLAAVEIARPLGVAPIAPTISGVTSSAITASAATISWATDQPSSTQVAYGPTASYGSSSPLVTNPVLNHSVVLTSLTPATTYHFQATSVNSIGTTASIDYTFTTSSGLMAQSINFAPIAARTVAQTPLTVSATATSSLAVAFSTSTQSVCTVGGTNGSVVTLLTVGTCTVIANQSGSGAYSAAPPVSQSFTITPVATATISVDTTSSVDGRDTQTVTGFSTVTAGDVIVAFVAADGAGTGSQSATLSGGGLIWNLASRANGQSGTAEIWQATASGTLSSVSISSTLAAAGFDQSLTVVAFKGAAGIGASASGGALLGSPSAALTTTKSGSWVFGTANDWDRAASVIPAAAQVLVHQWIDTPAADTLWVQSTLAPTPSALTVVNLTDTAPLNDRWNMAAVEIIPALPPAPPTIPILSAVAASSITTTSASIGWTTDQSSSSSVDYGLTGSYGSSTGVDATSVTTHVRTLSGLSASTTYHYRVVSSNIAGTATSGDFTFTTSPVATGRVVLDKTVFVDGKGARTTGPLVTAAQGELLVAFVSADGPTTAAQSAVVTGGGLVWSLVRRANTQFGTAEVWQARAGVALSSIAVTSTLTRANFDQSLTVSAFQGAAGIGATGAGNGLTGAPAASLTTTVAGSWVYGVGNDWDRAIARSPMAGQGIVHQWIDTASGDTFWCQSMVAPTTLAGTVVTIADSSTTLRDRWNLVAVEITPS